MQELRGTFDAVLLATGAYVGREMAQDATGVTSAIDYLREVKSGQQTTVASKVVVIGGGDVAMDAARSSIRLGADNVTVVTLEASLEQMVATPEEKYGAVKEGVAIINGYGVGEVTQQEGAVTGYP